MVYIDLFIRVCANFCLTGTVGDVGLRHPNQFHTSRRRFRVVENNIATFALGSQTE